MQALDPRIVKISIQINDVLKTYTDIELMASGTKYANSIQNECEIKLTNLDKATLDYITSETSPFNLNKTSKKVIIEAGRVSFGTIKVYEGNVVSTNITQPPDISVTLKTLTKNDKKGDIVSRNQQSSASLSRISRQVATDLDVNLNFQAKDKSIANYNFSGGALKQVERLGEAGKVNAYIDDNSLIVKDVNAPLANQIRLLDIDNGMVGIPEPTEQGIKVKFLLDNQTKLGGLLRVKSILYPAANGDYVIYKLGFEITNRDIPFYWIAEAKRI